LNCETTIAKAKNDYHRSLVENLSDYSTASKKWWSVINDLTGKKQKEGIPFLNAQNGVKIFDDYGKCSLLNDYFAQQSHLDDTGVVTLPVTLLTYNLLIQYVLPLLKCRRLSKAWPYRKQLAKT
jgi:hypothetical protein